MFPESASSPNHLRRQPAESPDGFQTDHAHIQYLKRLPLLSHVSLLLPLAVLHQGGLQGDVVGYTLLRGEPWHQQVLAEGMGGFGIVKSHVRLLLSFFSKYHLKYSTAERKSFISYSPGTLRYRPAPVRSLWPILPNTRPSGEVMPSTAQTELLGLK